MDAALSALFQLPPEQAIKYLEAKGVKLTWNWWEMQREAHARAFTVAKVARLDILQDIRAAVETALKEGRTEQWFRKELEDTLKKKGWWGKRVHVDPVTGEAQLYQAGSVRRLQTIYRTNLQTAYMAGRQKQFDAEADRAPFVQYLAVRDSRTRPAHAALHGQVFRLDDPAWSLIAPPNGFNCFPAETLVAGRFQLGLKTWYAGPMVEIETSGGNRLAVTANHPILTRRGWLRAEQVKEADDLLCHQAGVNAASSGIVDDQQPPASAEQRFDALAAHGSRVAAITPLDFHGDAHRRKGEIHIAGPDGVLVDRVFAGIAQGVQDGDLVRADDGRRLSLEALGAPEFKAVPAQSMRAQNAIDVAATVAQALGDVAHRQERVAVERHHLGLERIVIGPSRLPGCADLSDDALGVGLDALPLQALGLAAPARLDAVEPQEARDGIAGASVLFGKLLDAFPGLVAADQVLRVRKYEWSGHVFDFQTETGLIVANGLVVHNCRCRARNLSQRELDARGLKVQNDTQLHEREPPGQRPADPRTGETPAEWRQRGVSIPDPLNPGERTYLWPDTGWDYNPGRSAPWGDIDLWDRVRQALPADLATQTLREHALHPARLAAFDDWVERVMGQSGARGLEWVIGYLAQADIEHLIGQGIQVANGAVVLEDRLLVGPKAKRHESAGNALTPDEWKQVPRQMAEPDAVLYDTANGTLLYVLPSPDGRKAKIVVEASRIEKKTPAHESVRTAFKVALAALTGGVSGGAYKLIRGELK
jgi:SPP1 gp7 family putative phage head morphogenesis protein